MPEDCPKAAGSAGVEPKAAEGGTWVSIQIDIHRICGMYKYIHVI